MKISKIIFISLLGSIALIIIAGMIDMRLHGVKSGEISGELKVNKQPVPPFKVLCLNDSKSISLTQGDSTCIISYWKDSPAPDVKYTIKGDTLFVNDLKLSAITICTTPSLKRLNMNNSSVTLRGFTRDSESGKLTLELDHSTAWLYQNNSNESYISALDISARNQSNVNSFNIRVDTLELALNNSSSKLGITKKLTGSLSDNSILMCRQPLEIALKRDAGSKISLFSN
jgi:hypothetical protein